jgi:DNA-binding IclR family transcriptional regulator
MRPVKDGKAPTSGGQHRVQSVDRAAALLRAIAAAEGAEATAPELALTTGLNRATAWRILRTLELQGLVSYDPRTRRFSIGMGVVDLAQAAVPNTLLSRARTVVRNLSLQTRETVALALMEETELRYVVEVQPSTSDEPSWLGEGAGPLHATSSGKIVLAWLGAEAAGPEPYLRYTDSTIVTTEELEEELAVVRGRGYALCRGEYDDYIWGVSVPLLDRDQRLVGALSLWGPATRGEPERFDALGLLARDAARGLLAT